MSHHLTPERRLEIHQAHIKEVGAYSSLHHTLNILPPDVHPWSTRYATLTVEICVQCGIVDKTYCSHGASVWAHRPGCSKFDTEVNKKLIGPPEMYQTLDMTWPLKTDDVGTSECQGCLLVCPVCKADGT